MTAPSRRVYVLDTNVLLFDPNALSAFDEHEVVVPISVIEEVDRFKKDLNETGRNARMVSRTLDSMRARGRLSVGVPSEHGGLIRVPFLGAAADLPADFGPPSNDNRILATARAFAEERGSENVVLVTRDTNLRIKADALGVAAEDYHHAQISVDENYTGVAERSVTSERIGLVYRKGRIDFPAEEAAEWGAAPNQFFVLSALDNPGQTALVRYDQKRDMLRLVGRYKEGIWGIFARNISSNLAGYLVNAAVMFLLTPFVLARLGDGPYGIWSVLIATTGSYGIFDLGIRSAAGLYLTRYAEQGDEDGVNRSFSTAFVVLLALAAVGVLATLGIASQLPDFLGSRIGGDIDPRAVGLMPRPPSS